MRQIKTVGSGLSACGRAWRHASGRTSSWPCWESSSWWARRFVGWWCPSASRYWHDHHWFTFTWWPETKSQNSFSFQCGDIMGGNLSDVTLFVWLQEDILSIWNKTANDQVTTSRIRDTLRRVLNLPPNTIMEYKTHNDSLKYDSHTRYTPDMFKGFIPECTKIQRYYLHRDWKMINRKIKCYVMYCLGSS